MKRESPIGNDMFIAVVCMQEGSHRLLTLVAVSEITIRALGHLSFQGWGFMISASCEAKFELTMLAHLSTSESWRPKIGI